jgi:two-component system, LytTR family, response regulator
MKILIADDEPHARRHLKFLLAADRGITHIQEARNGKEAAEAIDKSRPDLALLDVQMPAMDAFDMIKTVGIHRMPPTIFITAHDRYAVRAFEVSAVDYLLKPFTEERLGAALAKARARIGTTPASETANSLQNVMEQMTNPARPLERIAVRVAERVSFIMVDSVDWFEAAQNYVQLHVGSKTYLVHVTLSALEELLDPGRFPRIHRSHIVNLRKIKHLWPTTHGQYEIELEDERRLESSRSYNERIRATLFNPF